MSENTFSLLKQSSFFGGLTDACLEQISTSSNVQVIHLKQGEIIFRKQEVADRFWLVISGSIVLHQENLREPFVHIGCEESRVIGISGLVQPGNRHPVTMQAGSDMELVEIKSAFKEDLNLESRLVIAENASQFLLQKLIEFRTAEYE
uniref:Cyclic nucleotide-binding domain-containing protein n=1 Tax=Magnetococcus massalia (strain MO-1) TaxID=451514 RepID=A0A1S7LJN4_MAGMO|nr:Conserved protein of unknown function[Include cyclic nucleotide-binding domain] [Candidatus Magnetococcus massalia]